MNTEYVIGLFGRISVRRGDQLLVAFPTKKVAELLLALALHQGQRLPRKDVIKLLWPGAADGRASNRLSATLYMLRRVLETHFGETAARLIQTGEGQLWLEDSVTSDLGCFERNWVGFRDATDDQQRLTFGKLVSQSYSGHLGADLNGKWYEPIQSLWASRWTEAVLWLVSAESIALDSGLEKLAKVQPILSVTRTMVLQEFGGIRVNIIRSAVTMLVYSRVDRR
jgi:DNA-binding SARP family transcriptional activator